MKLLNKIPFLNVNLAHQLCLVWILNASTKCKEHVKTNRL